MASDAPMKETRYVVQFLIVKEFEVAAADDIQAEVVAYRRLKRPERNALLFDRVLDADRRGRDGNIDVRDLPRMALNQFQLPDRKWLDASV